MNRHLRQHTDVMLDLETFGTGRDAAIVSIGAVAFSANVGVPDTNLFTHHPMTLEADGQAFHKRIDLANTAPEQRGVIDPSTVEWWMSQSDDARASLVLVPRLPLSIALATFNRWVSDTFCDARDVRLWSNGPTFDERLLREAYERCARNFPLGFRGSRCCRTMWELAVLHGWSLDNCEQQSSDILKHNAMHDAVYQARIVVLQRSWLSSLIGTSKSV